MPSADGRPRYVLDISPVQRRVTVGPAEALDVAEIRTLAPVWCGTEPVLPLDALVQLRAHGAAVPATVSAAADGLVARLHTPARGVAPGQALVVYADDTVLGSATVDTTQAVPAAGAPAR